MSTKKITVPEFKGATLKMYNLLKSGKGLTHAAVMAFKKSNELRSAYAILFRLRRFGFKNKLFTIIATGDTKQTRTYKMVKGVAKGTSANWPKALPVRTKATKPAKKTVAKKVTKPTAKKKVVKKAIKASPKPKLVAVGASDDDILDA